MNALVASNPVIVVPICATLAVAIPTFISVCAFLGLLNARRVFVELPPEREVRLVWSLTQQHVWRTRRGGEFRSDRHGNTAEREIDVRKVNPCSCKHASKDIIMFFYGDDFVR